MGQKKAGQLSPASEKTNGGMFLDQQFETQRLQAGQRAVQKGNRQAAFRHFLCNPFTIEVRPQPWKTCEDLDVIYASARDNFVTGPGA
jgi:hypothetical protein